MRSLLFAVAFPLLAQDPFASDRVVKATEAAWKAGRKEEAMQLLQEGLKQDPNNSRLLSRAVAIGRRTGDRTHALEAAARLLAIGVDPGVQDLPEDLRAKAEALQRMEGKADVAAVLPEGGYLIEGICSGSKGELFFAAVNKHAILRRDATGKVSTWGVLEGWAPLALAVDLPRQRLWAVGGTAEEMEGFDPQKPRGGRVACFHLGTGKLLQTWVLDGDATHPRVLGDLLLHADGTLYASDGAAGGIWKLRSGATSLTPFVPEGRLPSPQGMAWLPDGRMLLADYALGLFSVDAAGQLETLRGPTGVCLLGLDGLAAYKGAFIASQNGVSPARVWKLEVVDREVKATPLLRSHPLFGDPTLMTIRPDGIWMVANAQWDRVAPGGRPKEPLERVVVLRFK